MRALSLGYSPCPNDTFIFYGLVHGKIPGGPVVREVLEDIETLNRMARGQRLDITKISFHALAHLRKQYCLLHAGGALGRGCGPLVISREPIRKEELVGRSIAIPGELTTAALLLRLFEPEARNTVVMPFHEIMEATASGAVGAGVIIHESRFTYANYGLRQIVDLGEWWETETGHPIPLGGILARRDLGVDVISSVDSALRYSVQYAYEHPQEVKAYIKSHAQEMEEKVMQQHIELYVNDYTVDYGVEGTEAIRNLFDLSEQAGIIPASHTPLFYDSE